MKKPLLAAAGVAGACAACCAIPLAIPLLGGLSAAGLLGFGAGLGWIPLAMGAGVALMAVAIWWRSRRRAASAAGAGGAACRVDAGACGCTGGGKN